MTPVETRLPAAAVEAGRKAFPAVATVGFHLSDVGNAERLVARHRSEIRYCAPRRKWLVWDGRRWAWDETRHVERLAKATARAIYAEAEHATNQDAAHAIARHAARSEQAERIRAMLTLAVSEAGVPVLPSELDSDPWLFNVENGTLELSSGRLRAHDRRDLITKLAPVEYDPDARSAIWDRFIADATGGDDELAAYLQRAVGYALQGTVTEKAFWFLYGPPDGMKSTFIRAVQGAFGEYGVSASFDTWIVHTSTGGNRSDLVRLMGARLVSSCEVRKGAKFDEAILKAVTGNDAITAAAKYEADVSFYPAFALWLAGNDAPILADDDAGAWARVRRIPFTNPVPSNKRDPKMAERLATPEARAAILAWAVRGCLDWQRSGVATCRAVERSNAAYRAEMDRVGGFFRDHCGFAPHELVAATVLQERYAEWCQDQGVRFPLPWREVVVRLRERGAVPVKHMGQRAWRGIRLVDADPPQHAGRHDSTDGGSMDSPYEAPQERLPENGVPSVPAARVLRAPAIGGGS